MHGADLCMETMRKILGVYVPISLHEASGFTVW